MNNMTVFSGEDGKWWSMYGKYLSLNYSSLLKHINFDRKHVKKMKLKLRKGKGNNLRYETFSFKYKKRYYKVVNTGDIKYDFT